MRRLLIGAMVSATLLASRGVAQEPLTFEVASVKPAPPPQPGNRIVTAAAAPGAFNRVATVVSLIQVAYELQDYQVVGGPQWAREDRFDIAARAGRDASFADMRVMLRTLLAERFKLSTHAEQREMSSYALVLSRPDKQLGPRLKKNEDDCKSLVEPPTGVPPGATRSTGCGTMATFASTGASRTMGAPVIDNTGLVGLFQWSFFYDAGGDLLRGGIAPDAGNPDLPQYSTALQEQLGLKLEARRAPISVLVIDSVERPTPD